MLLEARFRRILADLSRRVPRFDTRFMSAEFVVDKVAAGQVFLIVFRFSVFQHHSTVALY